ncbi:MAG: hypothetical protein CL944_02650 [Candidatus Diapherotrites archaeon]|uniref:Uncharacterized protein n=1 Tax=Candidatus Iainarchaeum sp. TaxID=3101447 RepID=A0A2D6LQ68_9ARCH|nr:hypothetical protein [Candidatus Diapherotrites archaeon]
MTQEGKKKVTFCSSCGSVNIKPSYAMGTIDNRVECLDCKTLEFPIEAEEKFRQKFLEEKK